ncbi:MAG: serine/threonine-protein kinase [Candidatus Sulfotelmatobacter sp.]
MTPERWQKIRDVLGRALEMAPGERSAFLNQACSSDQALRQEVETLLASSSDVRSSFLQSSAPADGLCADSDGTGSAVALEAGQVFALRFQLVRKLGEGGMGQVWLAEQTSPVRRQVALKLIKAGMYDEAVGQRFQAERQSLAMMDHPAIAKVFDAGATPQGQPYFVMEYVPGLPITEYCDQKKLKIRDRLELFIQVCEGVQHAHQKAIIHRDLKPPNILVVEVDGVPVPRIIDFGLAKAAASQVAGENVFTQLGQFVGTPGYMSPEQADPNVLDIDTRTDVYSLGVVLYVLLAGLQPFETRLRQKQPLDELLRKLREEEPPRPSTKVSTDRDTSAATAEERGIELKQLVNLLRGDLDGITMKALEKDRARRYGAPSELAADIQRYLNHEPVVARPASAAYRSGKFIKRNKLPLAATAVFAVVVIAGAVATVREAHIARMQEARAEQRFESLRKLTNSLLFELHDSIQYLPGSTAARELVVRRALEYLDQIAAEAHNEPATLRDLAAAYERLGQILGEERYPHLGGAGSAEQAKQLCDKALAIRRNLAAASPGDPSLQFDLIETMMIVAEMYYQVGDIDGALDLQQQRLAIEERLAARHNSEDLGYDTAQTLIDIGALKIAYDEYASAVDYERRALIINQTLLDANPTSFRIRRRVEISHSWLGTALRFDRKFAEAVGEYRKALAIAEELAAGDPNNTSLQEMLSTVHEDLCRCLAYAGLPSEVRGHCAKAIAINDKLMKSDKNNLEASEDIASSYVTTGLALYVIHSPREALAFERRADSIFQNATVRDTDSIEDETGYAISLIYSGRSEADLHRPDLARKDLEQAQEIIEQLAKRSSPKRRTFQDMLDETRAVIQALPRDTAPIAVH